MKYIFVGNDIKKYYVLIQVIVLLMCFLSILITIFIFFIYSSKIFNFKKTNITYQEVVKKITFRETGVLPKIIERKFLSVSNFKEKDMSEQPFFEFYFFKPYLDDNFVFEINKHLKNKKDYFNITSSLATVIKGMYIMNGTKFQKFIFFRNNWLFFGSLLVFSIFFFFNLMPGSSSPIAKIINFYIFMTLIFILLFFHIFKFKFIKLFIRKNQIFLKNDLKTLKMR